MSEPVKSRHPKGLYVLFVTEMWERFSYYGMRAIFALYMLKALMFDKQLTNDIYANYISLVYLTPLIGGYVADKYWGNRKSIFWGGVMMAVGQFLLFGSALMYEDIALSSGFSFAHFLFYGGLGFIIFGNGFFKPNISSMVGQLYPKNDTRLDSAMTIFYMGINLGAMIAPLVAGGLGDTGCPADFKWGFLAAGMGMIISLITFEVLKNKYIVTPDGVPVGLPPSQQQAVAPEDGEDPINPSKISAKSIAGLLALFAGLFFLFKQVLEFDLTGAFLFATAIVAPIFVITDSSLTRVERQRIGVIYICAAFVIFFWSAFEQAGASLTFFADEQTDRNLGSWEMPASFFQSFNAAFIVIFAPIMAWLWGFLGRKNMEPASPYKQSIGLFLLALGYLYIAFGVKGVDPETKVSMMLLVGLYWLHTIGELALSPIGLSMVVKLSPVRFTSLLMGIWFLAIATSNKLVGVLGSYYPEEQKKEQIAEISLDKFSPEWNREKVTGVESLAVWDVSFSEVKKEKLKVNVADVTISSQEESEIDNIKINRILKENKVFNDTTAKEKKQTDCAIAEDALLFAYGTSADKNKFYIVTGEEGDKTAIVQEWNLTPEKPYFFGIKVESLYNFFMIFVFLAGVASVILFFLSKLLIKMMNGVR